MKEYHKIQTVYKRDPANNYKTLIDGDWSLPEFGFLADNKWVWTEKVDGTNIRVMWDGSNISFGGKTDRAQIPVKLVNELQVMFTADQLVSVFGEEEMAVCLYGEGHGAGIQKGGGNYCNNQSFVLFDVNINGWWLNRADVDDIANQIGIKSVPIIGSGSLKQMVEYARIGFKSMWGDFIAEGIVARPEVELCSRNGNRIITKIKHRDFATREAS